MYKVFFKESFFELTDDIKITENRPETINTPDKNELFSFIRFCLSQEDIFHATIYHPDLALLFSEFQSFFKVVQAAGGVVRDSDRILLIKRLGIPDLPKGHVEYGESIPTCAMREVCEECGVQGVQIEEPLQETWHVYFRDNQWHLKQTHWFTMYCPPQQTLEPQTEEDIECVYWLLCKDIEQIIPQTYASLREVFKEVKLRYEMRLNRP
ncbi:NUDIX hydrolase [Odoribacter lunatus]|uniref:NUDIX hydrolase n=1 Tax=Odoribacter lunatus TaxID=2941335 RepID=UPI0020416337|nr:NUDIX domain-containing protein [Odoribacter lunatus]